MGVTFEVDDGNLMNRMNRSGRMSERDDDDDDIAMSMEFNSRWGRPVMEKQLSYKVVGRLSRWEGGNTNPYDEPFTELEGVENAAEEKMTIREFIIQFLKPSYDLTEVTMEDIQRVKIMHDRFLGDAQFSFNYSTLLVIASVIAGVGLGMNSAASIIASMLVSPLMGPVTAIAYGISIGDFKMVSMAFRTEILSLAICVVIGFLIAGCFIATPIADEWPGSEMTSRGELKNFFAGIPIAFFSGLGVAVGLLDSQTNSLVGVAISASLLPPAVNAGMLWVIKIAGDSSDLHRYPVTSLCLTIMNIGVIIVASMLMFRLKETLPIEKSIFWTDLGVARKIYHNVAIIPKFHEAPDDSEIRRRVSRFFPRCSQMVGMDQNGTRNLEVVKSAEESDATMLAPISED